MEQEQVRDIIVQGETVIVPAQKVSPLAKVGDAMQKKPIIPLAVAAGLLALVILFVVLFAVTVGSKNELQQTLVVRDTELAQLHAETTEQIDSLEKELKAVKSEMKGYKLDAETLEEIYTFLLRTDAGEANYKFKVDEPIVVMRKDDPRKIVVLTASYPTSYWREYSETGIANVDFAYDRWSGVTTELTITPIKAGKTIVTFRNDANTESFKMMVVVVD